MSDHIMRLVALTTFGAVLLAAGAASSGDKPTSAGQALNCDIHKGACRQTVEEHTVALDISPKPVTAMTELTFQVTVSGTPLSNPPHIDLGMPGMQMGPNRVEMTKTGDRAYEGKGVIVRCPSGKRVWQATVTLPETGKAEFVFDVVY